ncbi:DUF4013 domain-containing protein [Methanosphaera sp. WGK6]|uniref:DUF4013 domain-containing protein n=1 Tax=Methanosphaera sp. WGK6 TaxID=1561964 RepID=UPI00084CDFA9|nr:DUF4013 domain-containing protein [Methanosphaera sp. WGK6]OED29553.1 hypothetical protein NL43_07640 [Methanosphaera sp. WGK6]
MILDIYKDSLEYNTQNIKTILTLGIPTMLLAVLSILMLYNIIYFKGNLRINLFGIIIVLSIISIVFIEGYNYRIIQTATHGLINGCDKLPLFNNYKKLLIDGIKVSIIKIIYHIIPITLIYLSINRPLLCIPAILIYVLMKILFMIAIANMSITNKMKSYQFIIEPYILMINSRATGLIYNIK